MIDAHCHCHWEDFKGDTLNPRIAFCTYAVNENDWQSLASYKSKLKAYGLHPYYANESLEPLESYLKEANALGEIGLDYSSKSLVDKQVQLEKFRLQLALAKKYKLPVVIHSVGATKDTLDILDEYFYDNKGQILFHFANFLPDRIGYMQESYFSFSKASLSMKKPLALLEKLKVENILIETDLFPKEEDLAYCLKEIAKIKGLSLLEIESIIDNNFKVFYQL